MQLIRKDSLDKLKQINKIANKNSITANKQKDYKLNNLISKDNPLDRKVDNYEDFIKNQKTKK